jgi:hypothetical protein
VDPRLLAGYLADKDGEDVDEAFTKYAFAYADQTEADHEELADLVKTGKLPALIEED